MYRLFYSHAKLWGMKNAILSTSSSSFHTSSKQLYSSEGQPPPHNQQKYPKLDETFSDGKQAYKSKSTAELLRGILVFRLLTFNYLTENQIGLMKFGRRILGNYLFEKIMKATFFGHFVGGQTELEIDEKIKRMQQFGVNSILDFAAEDDVPEEQDTTNKKSDEPQSAKESSSESRNKKFHGNISADERKKRAVSRVYCYYNEAACDKNTEIFLSSIKAVAGSTDGRGFAAIKATALCKPQLLLRISVALERIHTFVANLTGVHGAVNNQKINIDQLKQRFEKAAKSDPAFQAWLNDIESDSSGIINLLPWTSLLHAKKSIREVFQIPDLETGQLEKLFPITNDEIDQLKNALKRFHKIFTAASQANVRVMVDAEQTYLQPAISRIAIEMMKIYNKDRPIVYTTYQCYLKRAFHELITDLDQAERQNFYFGAKLVRGAYMEQERQRAESMGYEDPINPTYEKTTEMYEKCMGECFRRIKKNKDNGSLRKIKIMAASHNEDTVRYMIKSMDEHGISRDDHVISFGQLYGMCDFLTYPLGQAGYSVYKYVPYGPMLKVLPYLSRRAQENSSLLGKTDKERKLLREELLRRILRR